MRRMVTLLAVLLVSAMAGGPGFPAPAPRVQQRFDAGWRFYRGDTPGAEKPGFVDTGWRRVDLPHDFSIEDLPPAANPQRPALLVVPGTWKFKLGDDPAWKQPGFDDSAWQDVTLPTHWSSHTTGDIQNRFGSYRRRISIPLAMRGKSILILIGKVDDVDETFVNGVKVGGMGSFPPQYQTAWTVTRRYLVPARLLKGDGTDVVAVRDYNGDGDAGIYEAAAPPHRSGPFDADSIGGTAQGYTVGGIGWYRKTFALPAAPPGRQLSIRFDGVYMNARFWLNGKLLGTHPYGYTSFNFDLTPYARFGAKNVLAVRVDTSGRTSRWYSGSGIYRHVWLTMTGPVHIAPWGVYVTTPQVDADRATARARTTVTNDQATSQAIAVTSRVLDGAGKTAGLGVVTGELSPHGTKDLDQQITVSHPKLWSPDHPAMYRLVSTVSIGRKVVDQTETPFGIRTISFDAAHGFRLNGQPLKLLGGCVHHDNGCLGSAAYDRAEERRVQLLKANGFNAIRTSHNPPSPAFLDACDRAGMLVLDEAFDCWAIGKNPDDYHLYFDEWWKRDLDSMVQRDRNHPSVILWSIGNEIPEQASPEGARRAAMLAAEVRAQDPTRPVTEATNPSGDRVDPLLAHLDVAGYNYQAGRFASDHAKYPDRVFAQTESFPEATFEGWATAEKETYDVGDFVWTAMDYLGEAGIGKTVPQSTPPGYHDDRLWTVSNCGDLDLDGVKRPQSYYRNVVWGVGPQLSAFVTALGPDGKPERVEGWGWPDERPSWTWPGLDGKPLTVRVFSRYPEARLVLNGKDLGVKKTDRATRFMASWEVPYAPGTLVAVGLDAGGKERAHWTLQTAGRADRIRLTPDRRVIRADGEDLSYVSVELDDGSGRRDPNAGDLIRFALTGPGKIVGVGNGDPRSEESFQQPQRHAFRGRALVVIRSDNRGGVIQLTARAEGMKSARVRVTSR